MKMEDGLKTLADIEMQVNENIDLSFNAETVGKTVYSHLCALLKQEEFTLTDCEIINNATEGVLHFSGTLDSFSFLENVQVVCSLFDAVIKPSTKAARHLVFKVILPERYDDGSSPESETDKLPGVPLDVDVFLQEYRAKANDIEDKKELIETSLDSYIERMQFTRPNMVFSSLDYTEGFDAYYTAPFSDVVAATTIRSGLNFAVGLKIDERVCSFFTQYLKVDLKSITKILTCNGLIQTVVHEDEVNNYFIINPDIASSVESGVLKLELKNIGMSFILTGEDANQWPDLIAKGKVAIGTLSFAVTATFDLYNTEVVIVFNEFPTLNELLGKQLEKLPQPVSELGHVRMSELVIAIDLNTFTAYSLKLQVKTDDGIVLLKDIITIKPQLDIEIDAPFNAEERLVTGVLNGQWELGGTIIDTTIDYPSLDVVAAMEGTFSAGTVISKIFPAFDAQQLTISKLAVSGNLQGGDEADEDEENTADGNDDEEREETGGRTFLFEAEVSNVLSFKVADKTFSIEAIKASAIYEHGAISTTSISGELTLCGLKAQVGATNDEDGLYMFAETEEGKEISVSGLLNEFLDKISLPKGIPDFKIANIKISAAPSQGMYSFSMSAKLTLLEELKIQLDSFTVTRTKSEEVTTITGALQGLVQIGSIIIYIQAAMTNDGAGAAQKTFTGSTYGLTISVTNLLKYLLEKITPGLVDQIPSELLPATDLRDIYLSYDSETGETNLIALLAIENKEIRFFFQYSPSKEGKKRYVFGTLTNVGSLGGLPMVGEQFKNVRLDDVGFIYASEKGDYHLPELTGTIGTADRKVTKATEATKLEEKFHMVSLLSLPGDDKTHLILSLAKKAALQLSSGTQAGSTQVVLQANGAGLESSPVKWKKVDKKLGPVKINRIGFQYLNSKAFLFIDAGIMLGALEISTDGLGIGMDVMALTHKEVKPPSFTLLGLGLKYEGAPIEISGMFLRTNKGTANPEFTGAATIKAASFNIAGIGSYSTTAKGNVSLFIYAAYFGPIGGPSFFFVTGIAAGFGFNRRVRIPKIEKISEFPLVSIATGGKAGKDIKSVVNDLIEQDAIYVSEGDYWLAAGIKFTSFKIIDAFVLLIVQFGTKTEFTILGLAVLAWPNKEKPIAYIELALMANFGPESDVIAVQAIITSNSYIFDKGCKLTGGFAFYAWISGPHAGDFVVTLGGYHPRFIKPTHYPTVDRLALNWKIDGVPVTIKGEMYYALTPGAIMAGGRWEVEYDLSFLRASIVLWADMIISWAPFYYRLDAGIRVKIEARIKILFVRVYFSLEMGAELHIWGPPFAGEVYVDWSIFSFTIPFGSSERKEPEALQWKGFSDAFIPGKENDKKEKLLHGTDAVSENNPLDIRITAGVIKECMIDNKNVIIVNPYEFEVSIESFIPSTKVTVGASGKPGANASAELDGNVLIEDAAKTIPTTYADYQRNLPAMGIKPMDVRQLNSTLNTAVTKGGTTQNVSYTGIAKGVADALFGTEKLVPGKIPEPKVIQGALSGLRVSAKEEKEKPAVIITRTENDYANIREAEKTIQVFENKSAEDKDYSKAEAIINAGLKKADTRKNIASQLVRAGLVVNKDSKLDWVGGDIDFIQTPLLVDITTNIKS